MQRDGDIGMILRCWGVLMADWQTDIGYSRVTVMTEKSKALKKYLTSCIVSPVTCVTGDNYKTQSKVFTIES